MTKVLLPLYFVAALALPAAGGDAEDASSIREKLATRLPGLTIGAVTPTSVAGVYAVDTDNGEIRKTLHVVGGGSHVIAGDLYALVDGGPVNRTEARRENHRRGLLGELAPQDTIVFPTTGMRRAVLHVFTDVSCPHCRAFHADVPALNNLGIEVRYLAFARAGPDSETAKRMASAWCAPDPGAALTALKRDEAVPTMSCDDPVAAQFELARQAGVEGTPSVVTESGTLIHGHAAPAELAVRLGLEPREKKH